MEQQEQQANAPRAHFAVYDLTTGQIMRCGSCPADGVALQAREGEGVIEVPDPIDDTQFRVIGGAIVAIPPAPGEHWLFDYLAGEWVEDVGAIRNEEIETAQDYLRSTDWLVVRAVERGEPMDNDVRRLRQEARETISRLRSVTT